MKQDNESNIVLTDVQQDIIRDSFANSATPNLSDLTRKVFNDNSLDGRSKEGRCIKEYISEFKIGKIKVNVIEKVEPYVLSDEQKGEISLAIKDLGFGSLTFTRKLFNNDSISALHREHRAVQGYIKFLDDQDDKKNLRLDESGDFQSIVYNPSSNIKRPQIASDQYRPPATFIQVIARINKYLNYGWREENLKRAQIKSAEALSTYLKIFRSSLS